MSEFKLTIRPDENKTIATRIIDTKHTQGPDYKESITISNATKTRGEHTARNFPTFDNQLINDNSASNLTKSPFNANQVTYGSDSGLDQPVKPVIDIVELKRQQILKKTGMSQLEMETL